MNLLTMTREEAMRNVAIAVDTVVDEVNQALDNLCRSKDNAEYAISRIKRVANSLPHQDRKSYVSPYAKFDRIRRKRK